MGGGIGADSPITQLTTGSYAKLEPMAIAFGRSINRLIGSALPPTLAAMPNEANPTREALLLTAADLFSQKGYAAVGIREIAQRADVNISAIKYHFGCKHDLYLETVRASMERHGDDLLEVLAGPEAGREEAALSLVRFIGLFFRRLSEEDGFDVCGLLMLREALQPSEAIDAVVRDYLEPTTRLMSAVAPGTDEAGLHGQVTSLVGQLLHYRIFRSFIERLRGVSFADPMVADESARQIALFTLGGLGCEEDFIERVMKRADAEAAAHGEGTQS